MSVVPNPLLLVKFHLRFLSMACEELSDTTEANSGRLDAVMALTTPGQPLGSLAADIERIEKEEQRAGGV